MAVSIMLSILGLGAACAPLQLRGLRTSRVRWPIRWILDAGAGAIGGVVIGLIAGVAVLIVGRVIFTSGRSPALRWVVALIFSASAGHAGYHAMLQVLSLGMSPGLWQQVFSVAGAFAVGCTAIARLILPADEQPIS